MKAVIERAKLNHAREVAVLMGEFLTEIMQALKRDSCHFDHARTEAVLREFLERDEYIVLIARNVRKHPLGYLILFEVRAQHADDPYGLIDQLYVRRQYRRNRIARHLLEQARAEARAQGWKQLQLTMPAYLPLSEAQDFFQRERFIDAGGRKRKLVL